MAVHRALFDKCYVVHWRIELPDVQVSTKRSANLHSLDGTTAGRAAAVILDEFAQRNAKRLLDQSATLDIAGKMEPDRAIL